MPASSRVARVTDETMTMRLQLRALHAGSAACVTWNAVTG
jgi:hypothetical protein